MFHPISFPRCRRNLGKSYDLSAVSGAPGFLTREIFFSENHSERHFRKITVPVSIIRAFWNGSVSLLSPVIAQLRNMKHYNIKFRQAQISEGRDRSSYSVTNGRCRFHFSGIQKLFPQENRWEWFPLLPLRQHGDGFFRQRCTLLRKESLPFCKPCSFLSGK